MRTTWIILLAMLAALVAAVAVWLANRPSAVPPAPPAPPPGAPPAVAPFRIALVPERDIFAQRQRYLALTGYLADRLDRPVELVTLNTYQAVLAEFAEGHVEAAFLGSLVAVLTIDRQGARVLVKPESADGVSTYRGVLFVPADSPVRTIDDLAGRSIAMVKATTAGDLFCYYLLKRAGLLGRDDCPRPALVGTHDEVAAEVMAGRADAGAIKNLRLDAWLADHPPDPDARIRRLATSEAVPSNALVVRGEVPEELSRQLADTLLSMADDPAGRGQKALAAFGAARFVPCRFEEYAAIGAMVRTLGDDWSLLGIPGPPPRGDWGQGTTTAPAAAAPAAGP